ncbi:hypothetical protein CR152_23460 [Massilia violaceinigra]|uniref:Barstar (barnase inhibitor) domain-containing protein n=2 Tax=Massilia violaceinigra TaxID=2045208 RepID=A0A2D2DQC5_9BURK|nr:hypothetical protein CR152_23460 [Massilia violaceinigra]
MRNETLRIDLTYARSPLFVRQTVARAFGIPINQEFTWELLRDLICNLDASALPKEIVFSGWSNMEITIREEAERLSGFLQVLQKRHPDIKVSIIILD